MNLPARLQGVRVHQQGEEDYACGLYAVLTAAKALRTLPEHETKGPLRVLVERLRRRKLGHLAEKALSPGLRRNELREVAAAAGLQVDRSIVSSPRNVITSLRQGALVLARIRGWFNDPRGGVAGYRDEHYVVVLGEQPEGLLIGDPHPWRRCAPGHVDWKRFSREWRASESGRGWGLVVRPPSGVSGS